MRSLLLPLLLLVSLLPGLANAQPGVRAETAGLVFETLTADDLDTIQENIGHRLGVQIVEVKPGSPGAAAGLKATDLLLAVGATGVDSAEKAVAALQALKAPADLGTLTIENGTFVAQIRKFDPGNAGPAALPVGQIGQAQPNAAAPGQATDDPIAAYFDMMDFVRTQAWARQVTTGADVRQRVAMELQAGWAQLDPQSQAVVLQIPSAWANLQKQWQGWNDQQKTRQRTEWQNELLAPGGLYPSPANAQQFTAPENLVAFQHPGDWTGGMTEANGTPLLWMGPGGSQAQWEQVLDTPNSPSGALFALAEVGAELQNLTYVQGAHYLAKLLIPNGLASLRVVQELPIGEIGAVIVLTGKFPGQTEDKFFWVGVTKFGADKVFAGRMGGTVREAETLVPAFNHLLQTLQLNPPAPPGGGGGVVGAWETAWSRVDTAIVKNIWAPSGN